jgi:hypothetical protein
MPTTPPFAAPQAEYEAWAAGEVGRWRTQMLKAPNLVDKAARGAQQRINGMIPEKVHLAATAVVEQMTRRDPQPARTSPPQRRFSMRP